MSSYREAGFSEFVIRTIRTHQSPRWASSIAEERRHSATFGPQISQINSEATI